MNVVIRAIAAFNASKVKYCIFKEFDLIDKTLIGEEDLDLLISEKDKKRAFTLLEQSGFKKCIWPKPLDGIYFFIGYNEETGKRALLHVHTKLRIGSKQAKEYRWIDLERRVLENYSDDNQYHARVINTEDEICLLFIRMILRKHPNADDHERLNALSLEVDIEEVPLSDTVRAMIGKHNRIELSGYKNSETFGSDRERKSIQSYLMKHSPSKSGVLLRRIWAKIHRGLRGVRRVFHSPVRPTKYCGGIYAVVGVDGSGKSTAIASIINNEYMQSIGVKRIYGGYNEYWIPGLQKKVAKPHGLLTNLLCNIDRRLRVIGAYFITLTGNNVIFDRYFYDDYASFLKAKQDHNRSRVNLIAKRIINGWIGIKPSKTFYLEIDAETAYMRKQDYSFENLCTNIASYNEALCGRPEVVVIDATAQPDKLVREIISFISVH